MNCLGLLLILQASPAHGESAPDTTATASGEEQEEDSAVRLASAKGANSSPRSSNAQDKPVIELPEEVVRAGGVKFAPSSGIRVSFTGNESQSLAGGFSDPTRYIQTLPGVGNDSDFDGLLFVRGGEGQHNQILVDQVSVTDPYHFGAVVSFLNTDVIDRIEFLPGAFSAEYGNALGGVLRIDRRIGNPYQFRSRASVTSTTLNALLEGPLGGDGKGSWLISGRRSHLDKVLDSRKVGRATLPYFYDVDGRFYRIIGSHEFKLGFLRSGDKLSARLSDQFTFAPPDSAGLTWDRVLTMATLNWEHRPGSTSSLTQTLAYSWHEQGVIVHNILPQTALADIRTFDWRGDAKVRSAGVNWGTGGQIVHTHTNYALDINQLSLEQTDRRSHPRSPIDTIRTETDFEGRNIYSAFYAQGQRHFFGSALSVLLGARFEHTTRNGKIEPTPRLRVEYLTPVGVLLSGAAGSYRQFPGHRVESDPLVGNSDLGVERARHIMVGASIPVLNTGRLSVEAYHKKLNQLIVVHSGAQDGSTRFTNSGNGVARGLEFLVHLPKRSWNAWFSYTLGDVTYQDAPGLETYAPTQDFRHMLSAVAQVRPIKRWTFGMRWSARSGRPYTPVIGRQNVSEFVEDFEWLPVEGEFHSARFPWYHRLDIRAEREFLFGSSRASAFLEVINVYNRKNLFDYRYTDGYSRATPVEMLPVLPTFGVSVSF